MTDYQMISADLSGEIARITLQRPEKRNALRDQTNIELVDALNRIAETPSIKLVILAGAGKAFCAGYDVSEGPDMPERTPPYWQYHFKLAYQTLRWIWTLPQPVIARVQGAALGGGLALAMASDLVYASEDAFFGDAEIKFGGGGNMFPVLQWILGPKLLSELMLTGRSMGADEALRRGVINEVLTAEALDGRVEQVARHMCLLPAGTLVKNKASIRRQFDTMGLGSMLTANEDGAVIGLSTAGPTEFTETAKRDGVSAALAWQKTRFAEVGAF